MELSTYGLLQAKEFDIPFDKLVSIAEHLKKAHSLYNELPEDLKGMILNKHNEFYTLPHCLRFGEQATNELLTDDNKDISEFWNDYVNNIPVSKETEKKKISFGVRITEIATLIVYVEAGNKSEALERVECNYNNGDYLVSEEGQISPSFYGDWTNSGLYDIIKE